MVVSPDVLLVTVTPVETKALLAEIHKVNGGVSPTPYVQKGRSYRDLGIVNGASIAHLRCEMGAAGPGAAALTIQNSIRDLSPCCVIMVGIAFGVDEKKQSIGEVLVSKQLLNYELQKRNEAGEIILRGTQPHCSTRLLGFFRLLEDESDFTIPLNFGLVLSGEKLVDNLDYRESLKALAPEAIGGEMEGAGMYSACHDAHVDWILVKGICDWADGNKAEDKKARQELAATNAAKVVAKALTLVPFHDREIAATSSTVSDLILPVIPVAEAMAPATNPVPSKATTLLTPPAFCAQPEYMGSHSFVGRARELEELSDWAMPADPTNLLLFEAIGGNGKSMLTWEWTIHHSTQVRSDWAGRFWYSFYEGGATMADFCRHALAYMTEKPIEDFSKKKTAELATELLQQLRAKPWLLILDGLERVLVAYHRIDAAEVPDEEANNPTDKIVNRNPTDAIHEEDNDLLRALAAARPSKILVSSRLTPRVLINPSGLPIPGVRRNTLGGLRPADAEELLRSCGVEGDSAAIRSYLTENCDNHPLVIGILAGLVNKPGKNRGNFDGWAVDLKGGAALNLAELDLTQRRNHILRASIEALPAPGRQLLSTLALLNASVDYKTLQAFNPHLPPEPEGSKKPESPEKIILWQIYSEKQREDKRQEYQDALLRWQNEPEIKTWLASAEYRGASEKLDATVADLEKRGLLQWDGLAKKYDLHPVVRGVASGSMADTEREKQGLLVVDHFTAQPHRPYEQVESMEDVQGGLMVVRTLLKLGRFEKAADTYLEGLENALLFNLEAYAEILSLLRPFFSKGWAELPGYVPVGTASALANSAANALRSSGAGSLALTIHNATLRAYLAEKDWANVLVSLGNLSNTLLGQNRLAQSLRMFKLALEVATLSGNKENIFRAHLDLFLCQAHLGFWEEAAANWEVLDPMGRNWRRGVYQSGTAERAYAVFRFYQGTLEEEYLNLADRLTQEGKGHFLIRNLHRLRGSWRTERQEWALAAVSYQEAARMARGSGLYDSHAETGLVLSRYHLGQLDSPQEEAERLTQAPYISSRFLARLWLALEDKEQAEHYALEAYKWAWVDGEPYVFRYELTRCAELLTELGVPLPDLPPYDPSKEEPFPWEGELREAIEKFKAEKEAKEKSGRVKSTGS